MAEALTPWEKRQAGPWEKYQDDEPAQDFPEVPVFPDEETVTYTDLSEYDSGISGDIKDFVIGTGKDIGAAGEIALTVGTAGIGEIIGGFFGSALPSLFGASIEEQTKAVQDISDYFTYKPQSERGKQILENIAEPLIKIEEGASDIALTAGFGNPFAAALIKTALLAGPELILPSKGTLKLAKARAELRRKNKQIKQLADDLDIPIDVENMKTGIIEAAKRMTPDERAQNAPALQQALREAHEAGRIKKNNLYEIARESKTWVDTRSVRDLGNQINKELVAFGYDVDDMPIVRKRLNDLKSDTAGVRARLTEFENVRKRINSNRSQSASENAALDYIRRGMDKWLDNEFNKIAILSQDDTALLAVAANRDPALLMRAEKDLSAVSGDISGVQAWKDARKAHAIWKKNFYEDKVISQLIDLEATPEQYRQWLMGASTMNARREAASTIKRMKTILGDNHPAIEGIRFDFLFEVAEPLLKAEPNFTQFIRNYDATIRKNPSLVKELGLKKTDMEHLYTFATVQERLPTKLQVTRRDITKGLSQFFVGHKIAKAALRVNISRNIGNLVIGVDRVGQKQILAELVGAKYGEVAIPKGGPLAAQFIAGAALTGIPDTQE